MWSLIRFAACFRKKSLYNCTPVLSLCDRVSLRCYLAFSFSLFHVFLTIVLMSLFIFVTCVDFSFWYWWVCFLFSFSKTAFFASSFTFPLSSMFIWLDIHSILNSRFNLWFCNLFKLWKMLQIMYYRDYCFDLSIACIDDWLFIYI